MLQSRSYNDIYFKLLIMQKKMVHFHSWYIRKIRKNYQKSPERNITQVFEKNIIQEDYLQQSFLTCLLGFYQFFIFSDFNHSYELFQLLSYRLFFFFKKSREKTLTKLFTFISINYHQERLNELKIFEEVIVILLNLIRRCIEAPSGCGPGLQSFLAPWLQSLLAPLILD